MTVNERLFEADLISAFDAAAFARDRERMIELLRRVDMGDGAIQTADTILAHPERCGYAPKR
jgi:hypothetical protein